MTRPPRRRGTGRPCARSCACEHACVRARVRAGGRAYRRAGGRAGVARAALTCQASSEDICSFSAMVRLVVVSSWLSVILRRLALVSRSLSSISFFSRSFSCTCLRSRSLTCVACSLAPSSSSRFFSCSCASRVCLYSMKVLT